MSILFVAVGFGELAVGIVGVAADGGFAGSR
jgi:hypothetical protein